MGRAAFGGTLDFFAVCTAVRQTVQRRGHFTEPAQPFPMIRVSLSAGGPVKNREPWVSAFRRDIRSSVRGRATVLTVVVSAVILALALFGAGVVLRGWFSDQNEDLTERTVEATVHAIDRGEWRNPIPVGTDEASMIQVVRPDGRVLAASEELQARPALVVPGGNALINRKVCTHSGVRCMWVYGVRVRDSVYGQDAMVLAASPLPLLTTGWVLSLILGGLWAAVLTLIGWWTWRAIGLALEPVDRIRKEVVEIGKGDLSRRVPVPPTGGHLQRLAEAFNETLAQREEANTRERRFVSDASHDLRNPIAGIQTRLEVALEEPEDYQWRPMVREALNDLQRLSAIVHDLLELSRLDSRAPMPMKQIDLAELARREIARRMPGVAIVPSLESGVIVQANPVRLSRVLNNLLNNAERHADTRIDVLVAREDGQARLEVLDDGSGIPPDARERVFERFSRLAESKKRDPQGTGLGLPIAREIAEIYGGSLTIQDSRKGARFVLLLPLYREPSGEEAR
ncbi:ATP-binding protein [Streptosporangium sandarakinum]